MIFKIPFAEIIKTAIYEKHARHKKTFIKHLKNITMCVIICVAKHIYGHGLIGEEKECNVFKVYHFDYRGSTVAITDMYGNITDRFEYDTYGKMVSHVGDSFVIFGYNGRDGVVTDKNGLLYMRARYYNPTLCRFVNADIIHGEISDSTSLNRYAYVNGNPVSKIDPFGLLGFWGKIAIGAIAIAVGAVLVAATGGTAAAVAGAVVAGLKSAAVSGLVAAGTSAVITGTASAISGDDLETVVKKAGTAAVDGFADGFMLSGITFGASRSLGYVTSKTGIFQRKVTYGKNNFMYGKDELTIWRHGKNFRIDTHATKGLHFHLRTETVGIGVHRYEYISEIIGGASGLISSAVQITRSK